MPVLFISAFHIEVASVVLEGIRCARVRGADGADFRTALVGEARGLVNCLYAQYAPTHAMVATHAFCNLLSMVESL